MTAFASSIAASTSERCELALQAIGALTSPPDATLDQLIELVTWTFNVPASVLVLYGPGGAVYKAHSGLEPEAQAAPEALAQGLVQRNGFAVLGDATQDAESAQHPWVSALNYRFTAAVSLTTEDGCNIGALQLLDRVPRTLSDHEARILTALARLAMDHLALRGQVQRTLAQHEELEQKHGWLLESVSQDALTQVANRHALMQFLDKSLLLARREQQPLAVLLVDVRGFRTVNEQFGDTVGDRVLRELAARMAACSRGSELVGRMAGDEFMAVLYPCTAEAGALAAERYRKAITSLPVVLGAAGGMTVNIGVATGLATANLQDTTSPDELYRQAALALDACKQTGS